MRTFNKNPTPLVRISIESKKIFTNGYNMYFNTSAASLLDKFVFDLESMEINCYVGDVPENKVKQLGKSNSVHFTNDYQTEDGFEGYYKLEQLEKDIFKLVKLKDNELKNK